MKPPMSSFGVVRKPRASHQATYSRYGQTHAPASAQAQPRRPALRRASSLVEVGAALTLKRAREDDAEADDESEERKIHHQSDGERTVKKRRCGPRLPATSAVVSVQGHIVKTSPPRPVAPVPMAPARRAASASTSTLTARRSLVGPARRSSLGSTLSAGKRRPASAGVELDFNALTIDEVEMEDARARPTENSFAGAAAGLLTKPTTTTIADPSALTKHVLGDKSNLAPSRLPSRAHSRILGSTDPITPFDAPSSEKVHGPGRGGLRTEPVFAVYRDMVGAPLPISAFLAVSTDAQQPRSSTPPAFNVSAPVNDRAGDGRGREEAVVRAIDVDVDGIAEMGAEHDSSMTVIEDAGVPEDDYDMPQAGEDAHDKTVAAMPAIAITGPESDGLVREMCDDGDAVNMTSVSEDELAMAGQAGSGPDVDVDLRDDGDGDDAALMEVLDEAVWCDELESDDPLMM